MKDRIEYKQTANGGPFLWLLHLLSPESCPRYNEKLLALLATVDNLREKRKEEDRNRGGAALGSIAEDFFKVEANELSKCNTLNGL